MLICSQSSAPPARHRLFSASAPDVCQPNFFTGRWVVCRGTTGETSYWCHDRNLTWQCCPAEQTFVRSEWVDWLVPTPFRGAVNQMVARHNGGR